ncbi:MAG: hypothetical protein K2O27_01430 [Candidatus Amulumruptor sp.]|nr:hypothetical protein [Candidatus Amulumruptor sp.]
MKKLLLPAAIAAMMGVGAYFGHATEAPTEGLSDLELANAEALADDYEEGPVFTNWKEYKIECTYTKTTYWDLGIWGHETSGTYTATVITCGYGSGSCLSAAGC